MCKLKNTQFDIPVRKWKEILFESAPNVQMLHMNALTQYIRKRKTQRAKNQSNIDKFHKQTLVSDVSAEVKITNLCHWMLRGASPSTTCTCLKLPTYHYIGSQKCHSSYRLSI